LLDTSTFFIHALIWCLIMFRIIAKWVIITDFYTVLFTKNCAKILLFYDINKKYIPLIWVCPKWAVKIYLLSSIQIAY
jgi:hypothetical protein